MIYLTSTQEQHVIRFLAMHEGLFIDAGASRMVFNCTSDLCDYLHLPENTSDSYVIKVAMGKGGMAQLKTEVETFLQYEGTNVLAQIVATGRYIEIMENVDIWDFRDEADCGYTADDFYDEYSDRLSMQDCNDIEDAINALENMFGCTSDNGQIGKDRHGNWVAYDYGFIPEKGACSQTSSICDYIFDKHNRQDYLEGLVSLLKEEDDFMSDWEQEFLSNVNLDEEDEEDCGSSH